MLVLSREIDEVVMIGDDVEVKVVDIRGNKVRLGFTAPRQIPIHRKEVFDAIKEGKHSHSCECFSCTGNIPIPDEEPVEIHIQLECPFCTEESAVPAKDFQKVGHLCPSCHSQMVAKGR